MKKKNGYTLAEVLITLCLIGVIAAVCAPLVNKFKPDQNKVLYLKTYDTIVDAVKSLASNDLIYSPVCGKYDCSEYPLYNTEAVVLLNGDKIEGGNNKLAYALAYVFGVEANNVTNPSFPNHPTFVAKNGTAFVVKTTKGSVNSGVASFQSNIEFDVDGTEKGANCSSKVSSCKNPDRFSLTVGANGKVYATDGVGLGYLATRSNWRKANTVLPSPEKLDLNITLSQLPEGFEVFAPDKAPGPQGDGDPGDSPLSIYAYVWTADPYYHKTAGFSDGAGAAKEAMKRRLKEYLSANEQNLYAQGYPPEKVRAAMDATYDYFQNLINNISVNGDRASDKIWQVSFGYRNSLGYDKTVYSQPYYSGNHKKESTCVAALDERYVKNAVTSGVYFTKSYKGDNTYLGDVKPSAVQKIFKEQYNLLKD